MPRNPAASARRVSSAVRSSFQAVPYKKEGTRTPWTVGTSAEGQLPAGGRDVGPARPAHEAAHAARPHPCLEAEHALVAAQARSGLPSNGVVRDEVHVRGQPGQQLGQARASASVSLTPSHSTYSTK